jgi:hypothetical protein
MRSKIDIIETINLSLNKSPRNKDIIFIGEKDNILYIGVWDDSYQFLEEDREIVWTTYYSYLSARDEDMKAIFGSSVISALNMRHKIIDVIKKHLRDSILNKILQ